jgi:dTDP-4-dehydrorhamnose 3,5-epimerase
MRFTELELAGVFLVELEPITDHRGFFARSWCADEFAEHGLDPAVVQCNVSYNARRGTIRGLHYQVEPHAEAKLVRCTAGAVFDVAVDVREGSPARWRWVAVELSSRNRRALYVPAGFAHGLQTLADEAEVLYQMSARYSAEHARGVRWDDPALAIDWPLGDPVVSERDRSLPLVADGAGRGRAPLGG